MKDVNVFVAYEWDCPYCNHINEDMKYKKKKEIKVNSVLVCEKCNKKSRVEKLEVIPAHLDWY